MKKLKNVLTVSVLAVLLLGGALLHAMVPDGDISKAERRKLFQLSDISWESSEDLEEYLLDQFPMRDGFRTIKSLWTYYVLGQKDNNGILLEGGSAAKVEPTLDEKQVQMFIDKFNALQKKHFSNSKTTCVVIPDKAYFMNVPRMDDEKLLSMLKAGLTDMDVRDDLYEVLSLQDYYATDSHWRQECLQPVLDVLADALGVELPGVDTYEQTVLDGFYGVYYGQAALPMAAEDLIYLQNDVTENAIVTGPELKGEQPLYAPEKFDGMDGYDVFLHGAQAVQKLENPLAETDRELILFRDSYGSSIAPLLLPAYKTITLVDMRYVNPMVLSQFVDFHGQDVLILYSTTLINGASVLQ